MLSISRVYPSFVSLLPKSFFFIKIKNKKLPGPQINLSSSMQTKYLQLSIHDIKRLDVISKINNSQTIPFQHEIHNQRQFEFNLQIFFNQVYIKNDQQSEHLFKDITKYFSGQNKDRLKYIQAFAKSFLPLLISQQVQKLYLVFSIQYFTYLNKSNNLSNKSKFEVRFQLSVIQTNLENIVFDRRQQLQDDESGQKQYLLHRTLFIEYLQLYIKNIQLFDSKTKIINIKLAKFLKVFNPLFVQIVKDDLQIKIANYSTSTFLQMMIYLSQSKNMPYEYFYKNKRSILKLIQGSQNYSPKKIVCVIRFLQILSKQRFVHCQQIIFCLMKAIQQNLQSMEGNQLVRILFLYSKTKYTPNIDFIAILVQKIYLWLPQLSNRHLCLVIRSLSNLNYQNQKLIQKFKQINYELFLTELKYGSQNIGQHYQLIINQIQQQNKNRYFAFD